MITADVAIVGAGPAGCATALALLNAGVREVALIDRAISISFRIGELATPDVRGLLKRLGAPIDFQVLGHRPHFANISLWGGQKRIDDFLWRGVGHGWILDRARFDQDLRSAAVARGARMVSPATLAAVTRQNGNWRIDTVGPDGRKCELLARLLVDATGRKSSLGARLGAVRRRLDRLTAYATIVGDTALLAGRVLVEPDERGWWYGTRLPDGRGLIAFMTDDDIARQSGLRDSDAFVRLWRGSSELRERTEEPKPGSPIMISSAATTFCDSPVGRGWLAVGDAMMGLDPLTSSGISGALADGLHAAATLRHWLNAPSESTADDQGYDLRARKLLRRYLDERSLYYSRERRWQNHKFWARRQGLKVARLSVAANKI